MFLVDSVSVSSGVFLVDSVFVSLGKSFWYFEEVKASPSSNSIFQKLALSLKLLREISKLFLNVALSNLIYELLSTLQCKNCTSSLNSVFEKIALSRKSVKWNCWGL